MPAIRRLLAANRSEIAIRVFRTAHELGIGTVAMYSHEDRYALHRFKADEAYQVGVSGEPLRSYLNIDEVISLAKKHDVDAIHPGYGFLSENAEFAQACEDAGIIFVGPRPQLLNQLGDKVRAREIAQQAKVPVLGGSGRAVRDAADGLKAAEKLGFPVILKAAHGGGGRGMRVVESADQLASALDVAQRESQTAFGSPDVFVEKFIRRARHIEVQLMGDRHGNLVHLFERDCSVQRRHQKVVEIAPAPALDAGLRTQICDAALSIGRQVGYDNAGTVEFLVDADENAFYFIEVNPRIQVEHTVTEEVTGIDIVKTQILIAQGAKLDDPEIGLASQDKVSTHGFAVQCRVTTEDPTKNFTPDHGRITHYRSASGMGVRLDAGTAFSGAVVTPFYDSLLVKVSARGSRYIDAARRMERGLQEFRVRGVKTNLPFLIKLMTHPAFLSGECTTRFIDETPELFDFPERRDRATKLLTYLAGTIINGNALLKDRPPVGRRLPATVKDLAEARSDRFASRGKYPEGTRQKLQALGPKKFADWVKAEDRLLLTDTTFRDAHQSLFATRFRTYDLLKIADTYARHCSDLFSLEMWGGATFDVAMRFLKEDPWKRLTQMRERVPNILFQMLLRSANAVGYTNYPDNVVEAFVKEAAAAGIDVFRVFDALNNTESMKVAMDAVLETDAICEAVVCYSGDILDPARPKYDLKYYVAMAKKLESMGAHILAIKDMAGLCKPYAAELLVKTLKSEIGIPIHFHTHDTSGQQAGAILKGAEVGLDIADAAMAPMSGGTSQPNLNTLVESLRFTPRDSHIEVDALDAISDYWRSAREFYVPFESPALPAGADLYRHEMPGGQYTNLFEQARALGLADRWADVCSTYADCNQLLGDIVKVTPTSKAVGDLALFLIANDMAASDVLDGERELAFPQSVVDLLGGAMGQAIGGFPPDVQKRVLGDREPLTDRPGKTLPPADFAQATVELEETIGRTPSHRELLSYLLYDQVFTQFAAHETEYSDTSVLTTPAFFSGMEAGEEIAVEIEEGKTLIIRLMAISEPQDGRRTVFFELNGQPRDVTIVDHALEQKSTLRETANPGDASHVPAPMPGMVATLSVRVGDKVAKGQKLLMLEAMKMQTTIVAERDGTVGRVLIEPGSQIEAGDLLLTLE